MAIQKKDREKYLTDLETVRGLTFWGYTKHIEQKSQETGKPISTKSIYNLISGARKDRRLLETIKSILESVEL